jgi:hypothetical protein
MSKRFTDSDKWTNNKWYRSLSPEMKCLWVYLCDMCDTSGVWDEDLEQASFHIGAKLKRDEVIKALGDRVYVFDEGRKWWLVGFCDFQYDRLDESSTCRPIQAHIKLLKRHGLWAIYLNPDTLCEAEKNSPKGIHTLKDKEQDKDKDKVKDKAKDKDRLSENDSLLYNGIKDAFIEKQPSKNFTDWKKEGEAIKGLIAKIRAHMRDAPVEEQQQAAAQMLAAFWRLKQSNDSFWQNKPFLPSMLNSSSIFDMVLVHVHKAAPSPEYLEVLKEVVF